MRRSYLVTDAPKHPRLKRVANTVRPYANYIAPAVVLIVAVAAVGVIVEAVEADRYSDD